MLCANKMNNEDTNAEVIFQDLCDDDSMSSGSLHSRGMTDRCAFKSMALATVQNR